MPAPKKKKKVGTPAEREAKSNMRSRIARGKVKTPKPKKPGTPASREAASNARLRAGKTRRARKAELAARRARGKPPVR